MARVPDVLCAGDCGKLLWSSTTSLPEGKAMCRACRAKTWEHGTAKGYRNNSCRCAACVRWNRESHLEYARRRMAGELPYQPCSDAECDRQTWAREMCRMHYKRYLRASGLDNPPSNAWSDTRRSNSHARRARLKGSRNSDKVLLAALIERDGLTCTWCNTPIDPALAYPDRYSRSIDHTLPISRGGAHTLANATLMHLTCNISKGARIIEESANGTQHDKAQQVPLGHSPR